MTTATRQGSGSARHTGLRRWVPPLILTAAIAHMLVGAVVAGPHWRGIAADGFWNTVSGDDSRMMALWFMVSGVALFGLGLLTRRTVALTGRLPAETGWILLVTGVPVSLLDPVSGGWALVAIGILALMESRRARP
ncbi:DUF6463 family protein [Streptomyces sp. CB03238]|uniref:DUF6463 family protein n=1 Tax=Streptomyces sp. CB03238 TaxID=1907777 RepID=UPI000A102EB4|nr:DUF6463 family protein [Streptomyces sp. CB03238]ORT58306.1 hypothetical protein BKD26_20670 [Streptomyces sp. CB03238]